MLSFAPSVLKVQIAAPVVLYMQIEREREREREIEREIERKNLDAADFTES